MYENIPEQAEKAIKTSAESGNAIHIVEQQLIGYDYTQVGKALVNEWELPKNLGEAIRYQHNPAETADHGFEAALLNMAHALTEGFQAPNGKSNWQTLVAPESWQLTGLEEDALNLCMLEAGKQLSAVLNLMEEAKTKVA